MKLITEVNEQVRYITEEKEGKKNNGGGDTVQKTETKS
jgi:hypothetical protein